MLRRYAQRVLSDGHGFAALKLSDDGLSIYQEQRLQRLAVALDGIEKSVSAGPGLEAFLADLDLLKAIRDNALSSEDGENRAATIGAFVGFVAMQGDQSPAAVVAMIEGLRVADADPKQGASVTDAVTITTMHRSKGLEWPVVILPGLSAHYMPYQAGRRRRADEEQQESERRLMYVAMTRAIDALYLFTPSLDCHKGWEGGLRPELNILPSPFLREMNIPLAVELGAVLEDGTGSSRADAGLALTSTARSYLTALALDGEFSSAFPWVDIFEFGVAVRHDLHGDGRIVALDEHGITVKFSDKQVYFSALLVDKVLQLIDSPLEDLATRELHSEFVSGEVLAHSKYGRGIVADVDARFIHVRFREGSKSFRKDLFRATRITGQK